MDGVKIVKIGKVRKRRILKLTEIRKIRTKRILCKSMLAEVGGEDLHVLCIDDVTCKDLPWDEVHQAREQ